MSTSTTPVPSTGKPSATAISQKAPKQVRKEKQMVKGKCKDDAEDKSRETNDKAMVTPGRGLGLDDGHYAILHEHYTDKWKQFVLTVNPNINLKRGNKKLAEYKKRKADEILHAIQNSIAPFDNCEKVTNNITTLNQIKRWFTNQRNQMMRVERGGGMTAVEAEKAIDKLIKFTSVQTGRQFFESEKKSDILDEAKKRDQENPAARYRVALADMWDDQDQEYWEKQAQDAIHIDWNQEDLLALLNVVLETLAKSNRHHGIDDLKGTSVDGLGPHEVSGTNIDEPDANSDDDQTTTSRDKPEESTKPTKPGKKGNKGRKKKATNTKRSRKATGIVSANVEKDGPAGLNEMDTVQPDGPNKTNKRKRMEDNGEHAETTAGSSTRPEKK
ncbi:hypothetical protein PQX77_015316 [Marasmius sp. AFHP31]|nr:hypothetical protein PQX77_015316 [Marasmius sp. AFHP31]